MGVYQIEGGQRLRGELEIHGAKNAVLPILAASLLNRRSVLHNCPALTDVSAARAILEYLGCATKLEDHTITVDASQVEHCDVPEPLMREMRSSIIFLGALLARCGQTRVSFPGGCELGPRPIDLHLMGLKKLGVIIEEDHGYLNCTSPARLKGAEIALSFPSVGATENIMLAACLADGTTVITNGAREPEIAALADFINASGGDIHCVGDGTIYIHGVASLHEAEYTVIPDRIEAVTYLAAAAVTRGEITLRKVCAEHLLSVLPVFEEMGCHLRRQGEILTLKSPDRLRPVGTIRTMPYPGFPTDAQAPLMVMAALADGTSVFIENIFENRYKHVAELLRMGAKIHLEGRVAVVEGVPQFYSARVHSTDLRGGAALVVAALAANGISEVTEIRHVERGYEEFERHLTALGAKIQKQ